MVHHYQPVPQLAQCSPKATGDNMEQVDMLGSAATATQRAGEATALPLHLLGVFATGIAPPPRWKNLDSFPAGVPR